MKKSIIYTLFLILIGLVAYAQSLPSELTVPYRFPTSSDINKTHLNTNFDEIQLYEKDLRAYVDSVSAGSFSEGNSYNFTGTNTWAGSSTFNNTTSFTQTLLLSGASAFINFAGGAGFSPALIDLDADNTSSQSANIGIRANLGSSSTDNPTLQYNTASSAWQATRDGSTLDQLQVGNASVDADAINYGQTNNLISSGFIDHGLTRTVSYPYATSSSSGTPVVWNQLANNQIDISGIACTTYTWGTSSSSGTLCSSSGGFSITGNTSGSFKVSNCTEYASSSSGLVGCGLVIDAGANRIQNVADPVSDQDVVTKAYVDDSKNPIIAITLAQEDDLDHLLTTEGDYVQLEDVVIDFNSSDSTFEVDTTDSPDGIVIKRPGHYKVTLSPSFSSTGSSILYASSAIYYSEEFGGGINDNYRFANIQIPAVNPDLTGQTSISFVFEQTSLTDEKLSIVATKYGGTGYLLKDETTLIIERIGD